MSGERSHTDYLRDIIAYCDIVAMLVDGFDFEAFLEDTRTQLAVIRAIEVIGEAAAQVPATAREAHSEVSFREAIVTRNKLIHGYFGVDLQVVWDTVHNDLPEFRSAVEGMLAETETS